MRFGAASALALVGVANSDEAVLALRLPREVNALEFRVLGPLRAVEGDAELPLGAAKPRALLALLLLHRNRVVGRERLIDELWAGRPPPAASQAFHVYISGLRKVLGEGRVETDAGGYVLRTNAGELDAERFEELVREARAAEPSEKLELVDRALSLWYGEALADLRYVSFAQTEIARLEELYLGALEERVDAMLGLRREKELIPELEALAAAHPLRERLRGQLMLALYRSGRQAEALDAYRAHRQLLARELGLDPARTLQELEAQILRQDAALDAPEPASHPGKRRRRRRSIAAAMLGAALAAFAALAIAARVTVASSAAPTLLRLDPDTGRVTARVHDSQIGCGPCGPNLWVSHGALWERAGADGSTMAIRALASGKLIRTFAIPAGVTGLTVGFGAAWVVNPGIVTSSTVPTGRVERIDGLSGRIDATVRISGDFRNGAITASDDAIWVLDQDGTLTRIDPTTNRVSGRFATGALETFLLAAGAGYEWICECAGNHDLMRFDPSTRVAKRFRLPQMPLSWRTSAVIPRTFLVGVDPHTRLLWILGALAATLVPWDTEAGQQAAPSIGLDGRPIQAALARGRIWIAAGTVVDRVWLATGKRDTIAVPRGMNASGVAVDPLTDTVWVANSTALGPT